MEVSQVEDGAMITESRLLRPRHRDAGASTDESGIAACGFRLLGVTWGRSLGFAQEAWGVSPLDRMLFTRQQRLC
ncbi:hypothetical protein D3879_08550 [Pseudomonas cavernicola]|uniref:Uncharacterized protein n=1 Tax=Pseudomonas cavernicola TaxID=2320866 RepID=A0A418XLG0_9PSED|nr:hypothetical protein D3879_08550 [Pseudomonas cavernicola]